MSIDKWDERFITLAQAVASFSKDPSTQVGCIIARPDRTIASMGFNGFPRRVKDIPERYEDRPTKYGMVVHAEPNAIIAAREPLDGCTLYCVPFPPCSTCAGMIIQAGITRVVTLAADEEQTERWGDSFKRMTVMFHEAGVQLDYLEL